MSFECYRESPGKFDSRTLNRKTLNRWTGRNGRLTTFTWCDAFGSFPMRWSFVDMRSFKYNHLMRKMFDNSHITWYLQFSVYNDNNNTNNNNNTCTCIYIYIYIYIYVFIYLGIIHNICMYIYIYRMISSTSVLRRGLDGGLWGWGHRICIFIYIYIYMHYTYTYYGWNIYIYIYMYTHTHYTHILFIYIYT